MLNLFALVPSIASAAALTANADAAQEALTPSSSWNVDYAEAECRLSRTFGTGAEIFTLRIKRGANLKGFEYAVAGKSLKIRDWNYNVLLELGPDGASYKLPVLWYRLPTGEGAFRFFSEDALKPDEIASTRALSMKFDVSEPIRFAVGSLGKPLAALDSCYNDLLVTWGIDPAAIDSLKKTAQPVDFQSWRVFEPSWARHAAKDKSVMTVRLDVSPTGKATGCKALASSGSTEVDAKVCALAVKNARFEPAISASGAKVAAPFVLQIQMRE